MTALRNNMALQESFETHSTHSLSLSKSMAENVGPSECCLNNVLDIEQQCHLIKMRRCKNIPPEKLCLKVSFTEIPAK